MIKRKKKKQGIVDVALMLCLLYSQEIQRSLFLVEKFLEDIEV